MLNTALNLDDFPEVSGWLLEISLNSGWGGLFAPGEGVLVIDLSFLFLLCSKGLRSSGKSDLFARSMDSGLCLSTSDV